MEVNSTPQLYSQDSLAAEMLNKLQSGASFTAVAVPETISLQPPHAGSSLLAVSSAALNPSLLPQPVTHNAAAADSIILSSTGALDPALTQLLVAAQTGSSSTVMSAGMSPNVTCPSSSAQILHPVLSAALPVSHAPPPPPSAEMMMPADPSPTTPSNPVSGHEAMTITVHCTVSDTVIVVGQQNWQCCMCREICGLDASIDQHLSLKHNLMQKPVTPAEETRVSNSKEGLAKLDEKFCTTNKTKSSAEPFQTLSESALASLQNPDSGNSRSGLEREVALLMAQTFTHSGGISMVDEDVKHTDSSLVAQVPQEKQSDAVSFTDVTDPKNSAGELSSLTVDETGTDGTTFNVYEKMINKVDRAMLSTMDTAAKNDLLLVSTELARMQKELTSKRRQMKKSHRYIPCPECGKQVRNRKDLIKQHNRCHEKTKKYRCQVCNRMFKYLHTLRRHIIQQSHQAGMPEKQDSSRTPDLSINDFSVTEEVSFDSLNMEVDERSKEPEMIINVDLASLSSESPAVPSESKENRLQLAGEPAYEKILAALLSKGEQKRTSTGRKQSLLQCFVCDREIRNRNYYITRHARCHMEDLCYTCSVCGVEFYRSDYYKEHMLQHGKVFPEKENETSVPKGKAKSCETNPKQSSTKPKKSWNSKPTTVSCKICNKDIFNRTYNIKRHARQHSIMEWESILNSSQHSPATSSASGKSQSRTSASSGQQFLRCGLCGMTFQTYSRKRQHMLTHRSSFQCRQCDLKLGSGAELLAHGQTCKQTGSKMQAASGSGETNGAGTRQVEVDHGMQSGHLGARGPTWKKQATGQIPSPRKWTCPVCQAAIIHTLPSISRHMRELHSEGQSHQCPKCSRTYSSYHKMQRHLKSHGDLGGICDVCGKIFQTKAALRNHTKLHTSPEGMFQCPKCPTSFRFQSRLEKHMRKHVDRTDVCPHCGKVYISKVHLQRHISVDHLGIKDYRYKCDQCGAQFFENIQLRDHIAYHHEGIQIYTCKYCNKGFNCRPTMVRHERKEHTNYLPYKCKHCSQGFPEKSKLVAHEMTHTGMSPHKCEVCCKYFTTGGALRAHKNLHLGVKPFECSACGKTYLKNWHLQQHIRKAHQTFEVVYNLPPPPLSQPQGQGQSGGQPAVSQQSLLPVVDQSSLQPAQSKFLQVAVQGEYLHVPSAEGGAGSVQQQQPSAAREAIQIVTQTLVQTQGRIRTLLETP
ncbi:uncharacterized protein LOC143285557 [Babylonia areolata]|uniref:uncharacterized protein LOC143285557 n=1 Tax=Babylonia areolata TaxID=304850 RepID=UPI003FD18B35